MPYFAVKAKMRIVLVVLFVLLIAILILLSGASVSDGALIYSDRAPQLLLAAAVGAGLSIVGGSYQGIFKNHMADPYIMGISSGAALGAAIGFVLERNVTVLVFAGSLLTTAAIYTLASREKRPTSTSLVLCGVALGFLFNAITAVLMILNRDKLETITVWMMGNLEDRSWTQIGVIIVIILIAGIIIFLHARRLNVMSVDSDTAKSLGVNAESVKRTVLILCAVITAVCVSVSGVIGFVGLIIPNTVRALAGSDNRILLPISMVSGAIFLVLADTVTSLLPFSLPVGTVTAVLGAPFLIYVLLTNRSA